MSTKTAASQRAKRVVKPVQRLQVDEPVKRVKKPKRATASEQHDAFFADTAESAKAPVVGKDKAAKSPAAKKRSRNSSADGGDNQYTQIKLKVKNLVAKLRREMYQLEVYNQDASRSASSKKLAQRAEVLKLEKSIRDTKLEVRDVLQRLTEMNPTGPRWSDLEADEEDHIDLEHVLCSACSTSDTTDDNDIVLCDNTGCFRAYHQLCLDPPVSPEVFEDEASDWFCWQCECIADCLELIDQEFDGVATFDKWQDVFPEALTAPTDAAGSAAAAAAAPSSALIDAAGADESSDDDYNPDVLRAKAQAKAAKKAAAKAAKRAAKQAQKGGSGGEASGSGSGSGSSSDGSGSSGSDSDSDDGYNSVDTDTSIESIGDGKKEVAVLSDVSDAEHNDDADDEETDAAATVDSNNDSSNAPPAGASTTTAAAADSTTAAGAAGTAAGATTAAAAAAANGADSDGGDGDSESSESDEEIETIGHRVNARRSSQKSGAGAAAAALTVTGAADIGRPVAIVKRGMVYEGEVTGYIAPTGATTRGRSAKAATANGATAAAAGAAGAGSSSGSSRSASASPAAGSSASAAAAAAAATAAVEGEWQCSFGALDLSLNEQQLLQALKLRQEEEARKKQYNRQQRLLELRQEMEALVAQDGSMDTSNILQGRRSRHSVDYIALNQELFGDGYCAELDDEEEHIDGSRQQQQQQPSAQHSDDDAGSAAGHEESKDSDPGAVKQQHHNGSSSSSSKAAPSSGSNGAAASSNGDAAAAGVKRSRDAAAAADAQDSEHGAHKKSKVATDTSPDS